MQLGQPRGKAVITSALGSPAVGQLKGPQRTVTKALLNPECQTDGVFVSLSASQLSLVPIFLRDVTSLSLLLSHPPPTLAEESPRAGKKRTWLNLRTRAAASPALPPVSCLTWKKNPCALSFLSYPAGKTPPRSFPRQGWIHQEAVKSSQPIAIHARPPDKLPPRPPDLHYFSVGFFCWFVCGLFFFFFLETAALKAQFGSLPGCKSA